MKPAFHRNALVKGALLMTGSTYVSYFLGLLSSVLVARALGPDDFGRYSYVVWLSGLLVLLANHGLTTSAIRFISESLGRELPRAAYRLYALLRRWQFDSLLLVMAGFLVAAHWLPPAGLSDRMLLFVAVVVVSVAAKTIYLFEISVAKGYGNFGIEAASSVTISVASILAVAIAFACGGGLATFLALFAGAGIAYAVLAARMMRRAQLRARRGRLDPELSARLRQHLGWTLVMVLVGAFSNKSIETFLLNAMVGSAEVGFFSIAGALTRGGVETLSSGLSTVLMPSMSHAYGAGGRERAGAILSNALRYFQFVGLLLAGVGFLWAGPVVDLMYGAKYAPVIPVFRTMVVVGGLTLAEGAFGAMLTTTDNQRVRAAMVAVSVTASAVAAGLLVPRYGLAGAVAAHAISRAVVFAVLVATIQRTLALRLPLRDLGRLLLAAAIAATAVAPIPLLAPGRIAEVLAGGGYGVLFVAATVLLRVWRAQDYAQVDTICSRIPPLHARLGPLLRRWAVSFASPVA